jgi:hypothetical protein
VGEIFAALDWLAAHGGDHGAGGPLVVSLHAYRAAANAPGALLPAPGRNHFTILDDLRQPDGFLTRHILVLPAWRAGAQSRLRATLPRRVAATYAKVARNRSAALKSAISKPSPNSATTGRRIAWASADRSCPASSAAKWVAALNSDARAP